MPVYAQTQADDSDRGRTQVPKMSCATHCQQKGPHSQYPQKFEAVAFDSFKIQTLHIHIPEKEKTGSSEVKRYCDSANTITEVEIHTIRVWKNFCGKWCHMNHDNQERAEEFDDINPIIAFGDVALHQVKDLLLRDISENYH